MFHPKPRQRGFTLIEVLITLLLVAGALLGTAALQAYSVKLSQGSHFRSSAVMAAAELIERMEANNRGARDGFYVRDPVIGMGAAPSCESSCGAQEIASADLKRFETNLLAALPSATAKVSRVDHSPTPAAGPWSYTIEITWVQTATVTKGTTAASSVQTTETMNYSVTRTIQNRSS